MAVAEESHRDMRKRMRDLEERQCGSVDISTVKTVRDALVGREVAQFDLSLQIWTSDIRRESVMAKFSDPDCLLKHPDISAVTRWVVLDWLRGVCAENRISRQAFYSAIQLLDIFLTQIDFNQDSLQLVAVTALAISLKLNDTPRYPITMLVEFLWDDEQYTPEENTEQMELARKFILQHEAKLMRVLCS